MTAQLIDLPQQQPEMTVDEAFPLLWEAVIRKQDKMQCLAMFQAICSEDGYKTRVLNREAGQYDDVTLKATPREIVAAARADYYRWKVSEETPSKYIPLPTTWLNRGRWMDHEPEENAQLERRLLDNWARGRE